MIKQHLPFMKPLVIICRSDFCLLTYCVCDARRTPSCLFLFRSPSYPALFPSSGLLLLSHIRQWFNDYIKEWGHYGKQDTDTLAWMSSLLLRCVSHLYRSGSLKLHKTAGLHDQFRGRKVQEVPPWCHYLLHGGGHLPYLRASSLLMMWQWLRFSYYLNSLRNRPLW